MAAALAILGAEKQLGTRFPRLGRRSSLSWIGASRGASDARSAEKRPVRQSPVIWACGQIDRRARPSAQRGVRARSAGALALTPPRRRSYLPRIAVIATSSAACWATGRATMSRVFELLATSTRSPWCVDRASAILDRGLDPRSVSPPAISTGRRPAGLVGLWWPVGLERACFRRSIQLRRHGVSVMAAEISRWWPAELGPRRPDGPRTRPYRYRGVAWRDRGRGRESAESAG